MSYRFEPALRCPARSLTLARAACLAALVLLPSCGTDLAYRVDKRLSITSPRDRSTVPLPVTIDWKMEDFRISGPGTSAEKDAGYFAVFLDETPMPSGKALAWLARDDESCKDDPGCPDEKYLNGRGVYTTTDTKLVLNELRDTRDGRNQTQKRERHRATVVLLDGSSRRIGETAVEVVFDLERATS